MKVQVAAAVLALFALAPSMLAGGTVDSINMQDAGAWSCAKRIAIKPFAVAGKYKGKRPQGDYMRYLADELARQMKGQSGIDSFELVAGKVESADIVISGQFDDLTTGSRSTRFWVGFGAGASRCGVTMSATTFAGGRPVFTLSHARVSTAGQKSDELLENIEEVAQDVATALVQLRGECSAETAAALVAPAPQEPALASVDDTTVELTLDSLPAPAEVYVDNAFVGTTPLPGFRIKPGEHQLEFRKLGFEPWIRTLVVQTGSRATRIQAELRPSPR